MRSGIMLAAAVALIASGAAASAASNRADVRIRVWAEGTDGDSKLWTLRCAPAGGTLPEPRRACATLATLRAPFAPVPPDTACNEIYGGPQEALVTGTFRGRRVWARFNRRNGCEIARWARVRTLFPVRV